MEIKERQLEIIKAAGEILTESGLGALTTKNLAAKMGFSEAALYRHYASKEDILLTMLKYLCTDMDSRLTQSVSGLKNPMEKLKAISNNQFDYFKKNPHFLIAIFSEGLLGKSKAINEVIHEIMATKKKHLLQCVQQGQKENLFTNTLPAEALVHVIMGSFRLHMLQWRLSGYAFDVKAKGNKHIINLLTLLTVQK